MPCVELSDDGCRTARETAQHLVDLMARQGRVDLCDFIMVRQGRPGVSLVLKK